MAELLVTAGGLAAIGGLAWLFFGARTAGRSELREGIQDGEVVALAAGALYPFLGIRLSPIVAAAAMALSSLSVVTNANRLRAWRRPGARVARG